MKVAKTGKVIDDFYVVPDKVGWEPKALPKQPEKAYVVNTRIRVQKVLEYMNLEEDGRSS